MSDEPTSAAARPGIMRRVLRVFKAPVTGAVVAGVSGLDDRLAAVEARLDAIERRLAALQESTESAIARGAAANERATGLAESEARLARRVAEIEKLLGATGPDAG